VFLGEMFFSDMVLRVERFFDELLGDVVEVDVWG
jgi:hypothetical protein